MYRSQVVAVTMKMKHLITIIYYSGVYMNTYINIYICTPVTTDRQTDGLTYNISNYVYVVLVYLK